MLVCVFPRLLCFNLLTCKKYEGRVFFFLGGGGDFLKGSGNFYFKILEDGKVMRLKCKLQERGRERHRFSGAY